MSTLDAWIVSLSLLLGMFLWTYLTSVFITLLIHMNAASSEYTVKSAALDSFMAYRCLPKVRLAWEHALASIVRLQPCRWAGLNAGNTGSAALLCAGQHCQAST